MRKIITVIVFVLVSLSFMSLNFANAIRPDRKMRTYRKWHPRTSSEYPKRVGKPVKKATERCWDLNKDGWLSPAEKYSMTSSRTRCPNFQRN